MIKLSAALVFLGLNFYTYHYLATDPIFPDRASFSEFPDQLGNWSCRERQLMDDETIDNLGVTDYLLCNFENPEFSSIVESIWVTTPARFAKRVAVPESTRSTRPPTACRDRVGTSSTIAWSKSISRVCPRFPQL